MAEMIKQPAPLTESSRRLIYVFGAS